MEVKMCLLALLIGFLSALYHASTELPTEKPERLRSN